MQSYLEKVESTIEIMERTSELFYQDKSKEGFVKLGESVNMLLEVYECLLKRQQEGKKISVSLEEFLKTLQDTMKALEERDTVMIADLIQYELLEELGNIREDLL